MIEKILSKNEDIRREINDLQERIDSIEAESYKYVSDSVKRFI